MSGARLHTLLPGSGIHTTGSCLSKPFSIGRRCYITHSMNNLVC